MLQLDFSHADILVADMRLVVCIMHQKDAGHGVVNRPIISEAWVHVGDYRCDCVGEIVVEVGNVAAVVCIIGGVVRDDEDIA